MRKIIEQCPACGGELIVTQLSCSNCNTVITGAYRPCPFCKLAPEDLRFLEVFVMVRGNVKEMERELGTNYWTVRNRLAEVVRRLGYEVDPAEEEKINQQKRDILRSLERGEITVAEAEEALAQLRLVGPQE
jgi:hypothetical protein